MGLARSMIWMRLAACLLAVAGLAAHAAPAACGASAESRLLGELGAESALVRENALVRLERSADLDAATVGAALDQATAQARPLVFRLIGARKMTGLSARVVEATVSPDPPTAEAAVRALVLLGAGAVAAGEERLMGARDTEPRLAVVLRRLRALHAKASVEREILSRWRRKGGSYDGRFAALEPYGWKAQAILLAMLLDVPLEDRFVVLPRGLSPLREFATQQSALIDIVRSPRRGYRTFEPLPWQIEDEELFELAAQALMDVADMTLMGDLLEALADRLETAHREAGWQLRPFEDGFALAIAEVLSARGRPERLRERARDLERKAESSKRRIDRTRREDRAAVMQWHATDLSRLAGVLHRMREFDRAATAYEDSIKISTELSGEAPAVASYNLACALARGGKKAEALRQLDVSLGLDKSDLTREWVAEDGDLRTLHDDPAFAEASSTNTSRSATSRTPKDDSAPESGPLNQIVRIGASSVRRGPAIDAWMNGHSGELGAIARHWFDVMRGRGDDVRELLHDGHPTACVARRGIRLRQRVHSPRQRGVLPWCSSLRIRRSCWKAPASTCAM